MTDDPKARTEELRKQLHGILYLAFQRGRDSMCGTAGDKARYYEQAGAGLCAVADDAALLHEAYLQFLRDQLKGKK